jgi:hypothetical protein
MHVQDIAVTQIVKKCHVANGTTSVINEFSSNFDIIQFWQVPHLTMRTTWLAHPIFLALIDVFYRQVQIQSFLTEEILASSFHFISWTQQFLLNFLYRKQSIRPSPPEYLTKN